MFQAISFLTSLFLSLFSFLLLKRLGKFYGELFSWKLPRKVGLCLGLILSAAVGIVCFDIWSAATMAALHLAVCFLLTDFLHLLLQLRRKYFPQWQRLYGSGVLPVMFFACLMLYGSINMNTVVQTDYTVLTEKSIRQEGYRIAFLSDIHYGTVQNKAVLQESIAKINAQEPDIVILGGDIVEERTSLEDMQEVFRCLGALDAPLGIYFVYGNHDRQAESAARSYTDAELTSAIAGSGIVILEDEALLLGGELLLIGRGDAAWDASGERAEIGQLLSSGQEEYFLLTLDHQPLEAAENAAAGVDLMLSGHTHAGQIFPVGWLTEWMGGFNYGLYQTGRCKSIVSSGFAGWGYGIRTQGRCEYVMVEILPAK